MKRTRTSARKAKGKGQKDVAKKKDDSEAATVAVDDDVDEEQKKDDFHESEAPEKVAKRAKKDKPKRGRGPEEDRTCPYCSKVIVSKTGLAYHIKKLVCRKVVVPKKEPEEKKKRKKAPAGERKPDKRKRHRGSKEERTCPICKREFTSALGKEYHVKNKVCEVQTSTKLVGTLALPTLPAGSKFITNFGIVEVISDDRAKSTHIYPEDLIQQARSYSNHKDKQSVAKKRQFLSFGFQSRLRRKRFRRIYEFDNVTSETTAKAYTGGSATAQSADVALLNDALYTSAVKPRVDPQWPVEAFPDRMVTCKLIPDTRPRVYGLGEESQELLLDQSCFARTLYLRRRELVKAYVPEITVHICPHCGGDFHSRDGYNYHVQGTVCQNKAKARGVLRQELNESIETRLERHMRRHSFRAGRCKISTLAVYPSVWLSLGFRAHVPVKLRPKLPPVCTMKGDELKTENRLADLDKTLLNLRKEVRKAMVIQNDEKHGAMYNQVFKFLGFRLESKKKKKEKKARSKKRSRKKRKKDRPNSYHDKLVAGGGLNMLPTPEIIDIQVLIDEAKSGRYPSIQRFQGDHPDECVLCKEGGTLFCCDFCSNAVHLKCMLTRVTISTPDPEEDFLCHNCVKKILHRRLRAERRRLMKHQLMLDKARQKATDDIPEHVAESDKEKYQSDYHAAAAVGRELSELLELLADSKNRVTQMMEASRLNNLRRLQLQG